MFDEDEVAQGLIKWRGGVNQDLLVFQQTELNNGKTACHQTINWNSNKVNIISRKLFNETHETFLDLQEICDNEQADKEILLKTSYNYRAIIQACILKGNGKLERGGENIEEIKIQLEFLGVIELLWHLCEVLFIEHSGSNECVESLLMWVKCHFNRVNASLDQIMGAEEPSSEPNYWPTVYGLVLQGRLLDTCDLLDQHPYRDRQKFDEFANIEDLMRKMPTYRESNGQSLSDFQKKWNAWNEECNKRLMEGEFSKYHELEELCMILCGMDTVLVKYKDLCDCWYELLVAKLLYTQPLAKSGSLQKAAIDVLELYNGVGNVSELDDLVLTILSLDLPIFIEKLSETFPTWWFVSHMTDLLFHTGMLKSSSVQYGSELRDFLILEHASYIMACPSLWNIAVDYFLSVQNGREYLEKYLERFPLTCEKTALKLLNICKKHDFPNQARSICKAMGMQALHRGRLAVAMSWCLRSKDELFASMLTEQFLKNYIKTGTFKQCDLIENMGSSILLNDRLTFLGKYYEFHKLYEKKEYREASSLLVSLLTSRLAPKRFWMILMTDALPLLENEEVLFTSEQTYELMQCLEEYRLCTYTPKYNKNQAVTMDEENQVELIRLSMCKTLSRTLLL